MDNQNHLTVIRGLNPGEQIALFKLQYKNLPYRISARRHLHLDTLTISGMAKIELPWKPGDNLAAIPVLGALQHLFYTVLLEKLGQRKIKATLHPDQVFSLGDGRWVFAAGGMVMFFSNEYDVMELNESAWDSASQLIEGEIVLCREVLTTACQVLTDIMAGRTIAELLGRMPIQSENDPFTSDPNLPFINHAATRSTRANLLSAMQHMAVADALLQPKGKLH